MASTAVGDFDASEAALALMERRLLAAAAGIAREEALRAVSEFKLELEGRFNEAVEALRASAEMRRESECRVVEATRRAEISRALSAELFDERYSELKRSLTEQEDLRRRLEALAGDMAAEVAELRTRLPESDLQRDAQSAFGETRSLAPEVLVERTAACGEMAESSGRMSFFDIRAPSTSPTAASHQPGAGESQDAHPTRDQGNKTAAMRPPPAGVARKSDSEFREPEDEAAPAVTPRCSADGPA